jgi:Arc/MetJ family transcription regulator
MRTTIRLDDQLLEKARQYALAHETTFTAIVEDALRAKLMGRPGGEKQQPVKLKTVGGNGVNTGVDLDDSASLLDVMEE